MSRSMIRMRGARARAISIQTLPAILTAAAGIGLAIAVATLAAPAKAYDDDVDVVCWDRDDGETECQTIEELTAECEVADPEYTTDQCQGLLESRRPVGIGLTTKDKSKRYRDDNGGKGDREPSGGNRGGGSSGGANGGGAGSGPNG